MNPYAAPTETIVDQPRPACDGDFTPFWDLIDRPNNTHLAADLANLYCGTCPLRDTHLMVTRTDDEYWAPAAHAIREQLGIIARRNAADAAA